MNSLKKLRIAAALCCAALVSRADTITHEIAIAASDRDWEQTVSVPKFRPQLGHLNSVTLTITGTASSSATFLHVGSPRARLVAFGVYHTFRASAPGLSAEAVNVGSAAVPIWLYSGQPQSFVFSDSTVTGFDTGTQHGGWLGAGTVDITASSEVIAEYGLSANGRSQLTSTVWTESSAVVSVTYDYTPKRQ